MNSTKTPLQLTLGSDPECHVFDTTQGRVVSAIPVVKRDKYDPLDLKDGIKMYSDGVLVEASFPPSDTVDEVIGRFKTVLTRMQESLGDRYRILPKAAHVYDEDQLSDPAAWAVGCSTNYNAWTMTANEPTEFKDGLRTGSFHLHLGNKDYAKKGNNAHLLTFQSRQDAIKLLDVFVGCASVLFDADETAPLRRKYYGLASEHRPTAYGIEYRCLGNYALRSPKLTRLVYDLVDHAISHLTEGTATDVITACGPDSIQRAINTNDKALAAKVLSAAKLPLGLFSRVRKDWGQPDMYREWAL